MLLHIYCAITDVWQVQGGCCHYDYCAVLACTECSLCDCGLSTGVLTLLVAVKQTTGTNSGNHLMLYELNFVYT